jgi:glycosyltransferase involved in cell wall biosynthesis
VQLKRSHRKQLTVSANGKTLQDYRTDTPALPMTAIRNSIKTKRILFVTRTYEYGGAEKHLIELLHRLCRSEVQISVVCFGKDLFTERLWDCPNLVVRSIARIPSSLTAWVSFFRSCQVDTVVLVYSWSWNLHWLAPIGAWLARVPARYAIQHLVTPAVVPESTAHQILQRIFRHLNLKLSAMTFQAIICVSDAVKSTLVKQYAFPEKVMQTIHNGVCLSQFVPPCEDGARIRHQYEISKNDFLLVCVARLSEQKGIDILLKALSLSAEKGLPFKCIIVGAGPLRDDLELMATDLGLDGRVIFAGFHEDVRPYLWASSAFIMTSYREGLPLAILEAMACGLPCIVTDVGGNREAITDHVNGLLVPPGSVDAVVEAISLLISCPDEQARMSRAALDRVQQAFDVETCMTKIISVILQ